MPSRPLVLYSSDVVSLARTSEVLPKRRRCLIFGKHNITADVEVIPIQKVNEAYERLSSADVKYRFSIDMASLKSQHQAQQPPLSSNAIQERHKKNRVDGKKQAKQQKKKNKINKKQT